MTLDDYAKLYDGLVCRWDYAPLTGKISHYNHSGGEEVEDFEMPQWISMKCSNCGYAWSLHKVPICAITRIGATPNAMRGMRMARKTRRRIMDQVDYLLTVFKWTEAACGLKPVIRAVYVGEEQWRLAESIPSHPTGSTVSAATIKA